MRGHAPFVRAATGLLVVAGFALRAIHLGTPSIWFDELVHIHTALGTDAWDVLQRVRRGTWPEAANNLAMPLDYLLLFTYLRTVPQPGPELLEAYFRLPSFVYACAALVLLRQYCLRFWGRMVTLVVTATFALSLPHVAYAAEVRFYALLVLLTVASLWTFAGVVSAPSRRTWALHGIVSVLYLLTGAFALFTIAAQYAVLVWSWRFGAHTGRAVARTRRMVMPAVTALVLVALTAVWFGRVDPGFVFARPQAAAPQLGLKVLDTLWFFCSGSRVLVVIAIVGICLAIARAVRTRDEAALQVSACLLSLLAIVPIVLVMHDRHYFYHPRHVLFLLPTFHVVMAIGLATGAQAFESIRRRRWPVVPGWLLPTVIVSFVLVGSIPEAWAYVRAPGGIFLRTKTLRNFKGLARTLQARVRALPLGQVYLLITEENREGRIANPVLRQYVRWYRLAPRVRVRAAPSAALAMGQWSRACGRGPGCLKIDPGNIERRLGLSDLTDGRTPLRALLRQLRPTGSLPRPVGGGGILWYRREEPSPSMPGFRPKPLGGMVLYEP